MADDSLFSSRARSTTTRRRCDGCCCGSGCGGSIWRRCCGCCCCGGSCDSGCVGGGTGRRRCRWCAIIVEAAAADAVRCSMLIASAAVPVATMMRLSVLRGWTAPVMRAFCPITGAVVMVRWLLLLRRLMLCWLQLLLLLAGGRLLFATGWAIVAEKMTTKTKLINIHGNQTLCRPNLNCLRFFRHHRDIEPDLEKYEEIYALCETQDWHLSLDVCSWQSVACLQNSFEY